MRRYACRVGPSVALLCAVVAVIALAGCGSSFAPSAGDPSQIAPPRSALYIEIVVYPQGSLRDAAERALTRLIGHSPDAALQRLAAKLFKHFGLRYSSDVQPWLGQRIGFVVTALSRAGLALIAPTSDTSAALSALRRAERSAHLAAASYGGVRYEQGTTPRGHPVALGIVAHDAVIGGPDAFHAIVDASHGDSIAQAPGFASVFDGLPANSLIRGYINGPRIGAGISALLGAVPSTSALPSGAGAALLDIVRHQLRGECGFSLAVSPRAFTIDLRSSNPHPSHGSDVSRLPEQSWLALSTAVLGGQRARALLGASDGQNPLFAQSLALFRQRSGFDLIHDLIPALGPLTISIQGTSIVGLAAGLTLTPSDPAAAARLLGAIYRLASRSTSLAVHGTPRFFVITKPGLPIPRITVAQVGPRVLATVDETLGQLLAPTAPLAVNPVFSRARAALPAGSNVPLFIDFRPIAMLLQSIPSLASGSAHKVLAVVQRLDYLVLGDSPDGADDRLVLALR